MKYAKPEVVVLADAVEAVKCGTGKRFHPGDSISSFGPCAAYEADE
jgi:hypothetical protein